MNKEFETLESDSDEDNLSEEEYEKAKKEKA